MSGPTLAISEEMDVMKYRQPGESHKEKCTRVASALGDNEAHFHKFREMLMDQRFLPAGRVQAAIGASRMVTPYNCFVSRVVGDSMNSIMLAATEAAETMRLGGGIGYDFSKIRPKGDLIRSLDSAASGPVSFMDIFNSVCRTISSAGHRRGAQMGVLRVDHPDIEDFIRAKRDTTSLTAFNISIGITDQFMSCVKYGRPFELSFDGRVYRTVDARNLWDEIMRSTWDYAEPGVLFLDTINEFNNLYYCEEISATNPCAEQPLPPWGACLLGSFNTVRYVKRQEDMTWFNWNQFRNDIRVAVQGMDNVIDRAIYPLKEQSREARSKRRMGLGVTGMANTIEAMGFPYGSENYIRYQDEILKVLRDEAYFASSALAREKGSFELFSKEEFLEGRFAKTLTPAIRNHIARWGLRNSHLTSIAPTGTISLVADNVSSGIEPVFSHEYTRTVHKGDHTVPERVTDYGLRTFGIRGKTAQECTVDDHLHVLLSASQWVDSAVSKTCNIGDDVGWEEFKSIYERAYEGGAKGCTTFRAAGKRIGILTTDEGEPEACVYDPENGRKTCE